ncbi:hypothetical protein [Candidatus Terasakiella magnetica]|nr:hypothetical protein [Candidatus Terasakiella magnetica]
MSSVTKPVAASTSPVASSRSGNSARQVASQSGLVSELFAQTGVKGEEENKGFDNFNQGQQHRNNSHEQPHTLKLHGTSRTFAMLFEESQHEANALSEEGYYDEENSATSGKPAFQAYMARATSTYETSTRAISGELKVRGGSLNIAM